MYSTQCISVNVQCTSNTIQPESRIKKVETQRKKKKEKKKNCYKWQSPEALFARRRKHHAEAIERNKSSCDRRPTCPTALLLVLHITKSHVAITTYLHVSPGYLSHIPFAVPKPFRPPVHSATYLFHCPPYISCFFHLSLHVPSSCLSLPRSASRGVQVQEVFLSAGPSSSGWSQTKHRKKMCLSVLLVVCMHMHGRSFALFCSTSVPSPSSLRCIGEERNVLDFLPMSLFLHSILPVCCPATYDATQEL